MKLLTRVSIERQEIATQSGMSTVVIKTSGRLIPSNPRW